MYQNPFFFSPAAQIRERKEREALAKERERGAELEQVGGEHGGLDHDQEEHEGEQWGKAGPGGAYWRACAVTGQGFLDKMVDNADLDLQFPDDQCTMCTLYSRIPL